MTSSALFEIYQPNILFYGTEAGNVSAWDYCSYPCKKSQRLDHLWRWIYGCFQVHFWRNTQVGIKKCCNHEYNNNYDSYLLLQQAVLTRNLILCRGWSAEFVVQDLVLNYQIIVLTDYGKLSLKCPGQYWQLVVLLHHVVREQVRW